MTPLAATSRLPRIRLLAGGHVVIGVTILLGVLAVHSGLNVLHALVAALLAFQVVAGLRSFLVLRGLAISAAPPAHVDAGEEAPLQIVVTNRKRRLTAVSLEVDVEVQEEGLISVGPAWIGAIAPGETVEAVLPFHGERRGVAHLVAVTVSTSWPCDLFRRRYRYPLPAEVLVRPRRVDARPRDRAGPDETEGRVRVAARGDGEFKSLREFREGDSPRAIHWRTTARAGRRMVKEHESTLPAPWIVVWAPVPVEGSDPAGAPDPATEHEAAVAELRLPGVAHPIVVADRRGLAEALDALARFVPVEAPLPSTRARGRAFLLGARATPPQGAVSAERAPFPWAEPPPAREEGKA